MKSIEDVMDEIDERILGIEEDLAAFCRDGEECLPEAREHRVLLAELRDLRLWIID